MRQANDEDGKNCCISDEEQLIIVLETELCNPDRATKTYFFPLVNQFVKEHKVSQMKISNQVKKRTVLIVF